MTDQLPKTPAGARQALLMLGGAGNAGEVSATLGTASMASARRLLRQGLATRLVESLGSGQYTVGHGQCEAGLLVRCVKTATAVCGCGCGLSLCAEHFQLQDG